MVISHFHSFMQDCDVRINIEKWNETELDQLTHSYICLLSFFIFIYFTLFHYFMATHCIEK